jgi:hypothetical protein
MSISSPFILAAVTVVSVGVGGVAVAPATPRKVTGASEGLSRTSVA